MAAERSDSEIENVVSDDDDVAIAAVTAAELLVGVELANGRRRPRREEFVESVLATVPVEPFDVEVGALRMPPCLRTFGDRAVRAVRTTS